MPKHTVSSSSTNIFGETCSTFGVALCQGSFIQSDEGGDFSFDFLGCNVGNNHKSRTRRQCRLPIRLEDCFMSALLWKTATVSRPHAPRLTRTGSYIGRGATARLGHVSTTAALLLSTVGRSGSDWRAVLALSHQSSLIRRRSDVVDCRGPVPIIIPAGVARPTFVLGKSAKASEEQGCLLGLASSLILRPIAPRATLLLL